MEYPLHQFKIHNIIGFHLGKYDLSFTNSSLAMLISSVLMLFLLFISSRKKSLVPNRLQAISEIAYETISNMVNDNIGSKGRGFFPFVFSLFFFILGGNLFGMIPYAFTFTSHIIVTFSLATMVFLLVTMVGFIKHGLHFLSYFMPKNVPVVLAPILISVELISYLSRPISLSVRLFANMMAGHTMLGVFAGFSVALGYFGIAPLLINIALIGFEILVSVLQAYVFSVLTCLYLHDAINLHD